MIGKVEPDGIHQSALAVDYHRCHMCGACVGVCQNNALFLYGIHLEIVAAECTFCGRCVTVCPVQALSMQLLVLRVQ